MFCCLCTFLSSMVVGLGVAVVRWRPKPKVVEVEVDVHGLAIFFVYLRQWWRWLVAVKVWISSGLFVAVDAFVTVVCVCLTLAVVCLMLYLTKKMWDWCVGSSKDKDQESRRDDELPQAARANRRPNEGRLMSVLENIEFTTRDNCQRIRSLLSQCPDNRTGQTMRQMFMDVARGILGSQALPENDAEASRLKIDTSKIWKEVSDAMHGTLCKTLQRRPEETLASLLPRDGRKWQASELLLGLRSFLSAYQLMRTQIPERIAFDMLLQRVPKEIGLGLATVPEAHWTVEILVDRCVRHIRLETSGQYNLTKSRAVQESSKVTHQESAPSVGREEAKQQGLCFFCGAQGHMSRTCPKRLALEKESRNIMNVQRAEQSEDVERRNEDLESSSSGSTVGDPIANPCVGQLKVPSLIKQAKAPVSTSFSRIQLRLGDLGEVVTLLDTGADVSVVSLSLVKKKKLVSQIDRSFHTGICCFAGKPYSTVGTLKVKLREGDAKCKVHMHVVDMHCEAILGIAAIRKLKAVWNFENNIVKIGGVMKPVVCKSSKDGLHFRPSKMEQIARSADFACCSAGI